MDRTSHSVDDTERIAADFARGLRGGECLALQGDLGAGKTQFVRGLVRGLGGEARAVSSPTFVLLNVYQGGRLTVYHLDAYRLGGPDDLEAIGFSEFLQRKDAVVVVEWAQRIENALPDDRMLIRIEHIGPAERTIFLPQPSSNKLSDF